MQTYKQTHPDFGKWNTMGQFTNELCFILTEKRKAEADKIRERYSDRIPVICEKSETSKLPDIDKTKYLVPNDLSAYHFNYIIRKRIKLPETGSLYFFVNGRYLLKGGK